MISGANKFLSRLSAELEAYDLPAFYILSPNKESIKSLYNKKKFTKKINVLARLDGCSHVKFNYENLRNFSFLWKGWPLPKLDFISNHESAKVTKLINLYLNRFNRKAIKSSDIVIFQSQLSKQLHKKFVGNIGANSKIIFNGAPRNHKHRQGQFNEILKAPRLAITASFRPHKRLIDAICLVNHLGKVYPSIALDVMGDIDPLTLTELNKVNTKRVFFHGRLDQYSLEEIYKNAAIGLSPSIFDPCPNSVIEMLACGLPVLTTSQSGAAELVDNNPRFIIQESIELDFLQNQTYAALPKINVKAWAEKVSFILEEYKNIKDETIEIFEKSLEINKIAKKYTKTIMELE